MKYGKMTDDLSPEDPEHVPEEPKEHLGSKACPENKLPCGSEIENNSGDNSDTEASVKRKKRVQRFSDFDSDTENQKSGSDKDNESSTHGLKLHSEASSDSESAVLKSQVPKSRIRKVYSDSSSDSDTNTSVVPNNVAVDTSQGSRIKNKRDKLHQKFKGLLTSRRKSVEADNSDSKEEKQEEENDRNSAASDDEASSIEKLKQKIKERALHLKSTIYDPDTSDEENGENKIEKSQKRPYKKSTKPRKPSPKPARMSAKQAMENMQKIRSESNRMLREKEVSIPYHRPKALSLKDIMSRRRPAVSADGKALPIKMSEDQLKQYALMLEERQKEMMELCKSDTEEDDNINENEKDNENNDELSSANDKSFDTLTGKPDNDNLKSSFMVPINDENEINKNSTEEICLSINNQEVLEKTIEHTVNELENKDEHTSLKTDSNNENKSISDGNAANESKNNENNDVLDGNASAEMELVYNDSDNNDDPADKSSKLLQNITTETCTENDSQLISLHFDSENTEQTIEKTETNIAENHPTISEENCHPNEKELSEVSKNNEFPDNDDDINMEEIDFLIENAEVISSQSEGAVNSPMLVKDKQPLIIKPKLMGAPGMVIDLDGTDACAPKKSGVELLKQRFTYFAKLKTPEELEREKEKKIKPGTQHLKLKHELEESIAEQRSIEWAKRLEEERQQKMEIEAVIGDADGDCEDDIDKIEAKLEESEIIQEDESSESDEGEDEVENDYEIKEKPRKKNPLIDEEAEVSDDDNGAVSAHSDDEGNKGDDEGEEIENDDEDDEDDTEEESSDEDSQEQIKQKKGRILKAFEDSEDEEAANEKEDQENKVTVNVPVSTHKTIDNSESEKESPPSKTTEDDEIQLAQRHKSFSEDLFTSQEIVQLDKNVKENVSNEVSAEGKTLVSQTFSISKISDTQWCNTEPTDKQNDDEGNLDAVVGMCTGSFSQNLVTSQTETQQENPSQNIGDDILALCTGKFYDNQFVSQICSDVTQKSESKETEKVQNNDSPINEGVKSNFKDQKQDDKKNKEDSSVSNNTEESVKPESNKLNKEQNSEDSKLLSSLLDELHDEKFETKKSLKYFVSNETQNKENKPAFANTQPPKKRYIIDSDDETNDNDNSVNNKKKLKKRKLQDRVLQISDDEEELEECEEDEYESEIEDETERIVEYDSEENEVVVQPDNPKKKKKVSEFFEQEAELTSEDEWVGSGDEDEAGLDRMEREAGDDDAFHQGRLRRELEQIHMRDVLDQDKREVRLIQELLLEDGDLGGGHRQRKFRWKNAGGEEEETTYAEILDTQEEEFESEEQWRKQRHERETFLRQMKQQEEPEESIDINISRTSLIKATLNSKTANNSILDASDSSIADISATTNNTSGVAEKKNFKDIPSPKKPFTLFKHNYHGSLLTRGQGALARLAALALPLAAADDDAPAARPAHGAGGRNFVFTALSQNDEPPKVTKRKADVNVGTPRLVKKMRTADSKKNTKNSLLDHLNT